MTISIVGIYKHDFKDCPEELLKLQTGDQIWLQKEPENPYDPMAVRAYSGGRFLGYVACDALPMLHQVMDAEDGTECSFESLSEDEKRICASLEAAESSEQLRPSSLLDDWQPIGAWLHLTEQESDYRCRIGLIRSLAKKGVWEIGTEIALSDLLDGIPRIISGDDYCRLCNAIRTMRSCTGEQAAQWHEAADMLSRELGRQGRPEQRQLRYEWVCSIALSDQIERFLTLPEEQILRMYADLPPAFKDLYTLDPEVLIGRLYYAHLPDAKLRPLLTRLCINLYMQAELHEEGEEYSNENMKGASGYAPEPERRGSGYSEGIEHKSYENENQKERKSPNSPEGYSEEPFDCYFTDRATEKDRREMLDMLRALCRKDKPGNNAAQLCRQLKQWEKEGMIKNVFYCRKELYEKLLTYGFDWKEGSLYNAITKVMGEK